MAVVVTQSGGVTDPQPGGGGCFGGVRETPQFGKRRDLYGAAARRGREHAAGGDRTLLRVVSYQHQASAGGLRPTAQGCHFPGRQLGGFVNDQPRAGGDPLGVEEYLRDGVRLDAEAAAQLGGSDGGGCDRYHPAGPDRLGDPGQHGRFTRPGRTYDHGPVGAGPRKDPDRFRLVVAQPLHIGVGYQGCCWRGAGEPGEGRHFGGYQSLRVPPAVVSNEAFGHLPVEDRVRLVDACPPVDDAAGG